MLGKIKEALGNVSLETMLTEIDKLLAVRAIGLPPDLFIDVARYASAGNTTYYPLGETAPVHKAMGGD
ncbi:hypothetical protein [Streptomyces sp. NPDC051286]|uniref:hypothetical protein n=1 Tax=Streptomyces sp. NPDC051286 TaxID=3365647 RepID=UPI0037B0F802